MAITGTVTGQEVKKNRDGTADVRLLQVRFTNDSDIQTVQYMPMSGDDSPPISGDKVAVIGFGSAFMVAIGLQDSVVPSMNEGEKKLYSRDGAGAISAFINLLTGGNLELNGNAYSAVRFAALNTALQTMLTALNADIVVAGGAGTTALDISPAESPKVKLL